MSSASPYAFPERALRRWCNERLRIERTPEAGWRARFLFDGSTCGNIPLTLRFEVLLTSDQRVQAVRCEPEPGDTGHERMCSYLEDAGSLLTELAERGPLVGQPLGDALAWRPATSPAGCVCTAASRAHKWLAVLHTLHFALATVSKPSASLSPPIPTAP
jgi:hypothetical protein